MSETEERVIAHHNDANSCEKEKMSIFGSIRGDLILTNKRLVFIKTGWGIHTKTYSTISDIEDEQKKRKEYFEIPLTSVIEAESGSHMMSPYFTVRYKTPSESRVKHFFVPAGSYLEPNKWIELICQVGNKARYDIVQPKDPLSDEPIEPPDRKLILLDQIHTGYVGKTVNSVLVEHICDIKEKLDLDQPVLFEGKPEDEVLAEKKHLLKKALFLAFLGMKSDKFSDNEIEVVEDYVRNGGGLLLTPDPPWEPPNTLARRFGIAFGKQKIEDKAYHEGKHSDHIIVTDLAGHPINEGVGRICFGDYGCYPVQVAGGESLGLAWSSDQANPAITPVAALISFGKGRIVVLGQTYLFNKKYLEKEEFDNRRWLENIVAYLTSDLSSKSLEPAQDQRAPKKEYCLKCGSKLDANSVFCGVCGTKKQVDTLLSLEPSEVQSIIK